MEHRRGRDAESVETKYALGLEPSHERSSLQGTLLGPEGSGVFTPEPSGQSQDWPCGPLNPDEPPDNILRMYPGRRWKKVGPPVF